MSQSHLHDEEEKWNQLWELYAEVARNLGQRGNEEPLMALRDSEAKEIFQLPSARTAEGFLQIPHPNSSLEEIIGYADLLDQPIPRGHDVEPVRPAELWFEDTVAEEMRLPQPEMPFVVVEERVARPPSASRSVRSRRMPASMVRMRSMPTGTCSRCRGDVYSGHSMHPGCRDVFDDMEF